MKNKNKYQINGKCVDDIHQGLLEQVVRGLFVDKGITNKTKKNRERLINCDEKWDVQVNVRREGRIVSPATGHFLELDLWIPESSICFEFQVF